VDVELLDDVRQIRRVELGKAVLGDGQPQQVRRGKGLHELPRDQLIRHLVVEEFAEQKADRPHQADTPQQPAESDIHMDQVKDLVGLEKLQVVDPTYFRPVRVDHLLVQKGLLQEEFACTGRRFPEILRSKGMGGQLASDRRDLSPRKKDGFSILLSEHEYIGHRRVILPDVRDQIHDSADRSSFGIDDFSSQEFAQEQKHLRFLVHHNLFRHGHPLRVMCL
jgi:hypothetical protein